MKVEREQLIGFEGAEDVRACVVGEVVAISLLLRNYELRPEMQSKGGSVVTGIVAASAR